MLQAQLTDKKILSYIVDFSFKYLEPQKQQVLSDWTDLVTVAHWLPSRPALPMLAATGQVANKDILLLGQARARLTVWASTITSRHF